MLQSVEVTTQGDPLAMPLYALTTVPLIRKLSFVSPIKQVWYADDATAAGSLIHLRLWWDALVAHGPGFGYYVNSYKTWLVTKDSMAPQAKELFKDTAINITSQGRPHLGAPLGSRDYVDQFVRDKVSTWSESLLRLVEVAKIQPHVAHSAFTHGISNLWQFLCRTTPNVCHLYLPDWEDWASPPQLH